VPTYDSTLGMVVPNTTLDAVARVTVRKDSGADVGSRRRLNFIQGANVTLTVADDAANEEVDITVAAAGGGGGGSSIQDTNADTYVRTEQNPNEDKVRMGVAATERFVLQTLSPHYMLTGDVQLPSGYSMGIRATPSSSTMLALGTTETGTSIAGVVINVGSTFSLGTNTAVGLGGYALGRSASMTAFGLDFIAGCASVSMTAAYGVRAACFAQGSGFTLTDAYTFYARSAQGALATVTRSYGFYCEGLTKGTNRFPFYDAGLPVTGDGHGNRFRSNTQFGSTTGSFGGGDGVIGIANATVVPATNPTGGGVLYASGGALYWRGSLGTVTQIAPA